MTTYTLEENLADIIVNSEPLVVLYDMKHYKGDEYGYLQYLQKTKDMFTALESKYNEWVREKSASKWRRKTVKMKDWSIEDLLAMARGLVPFRYAEQRDKRLAFVEKAKKYLREREQEARQILIPREIAMMEQALGLLKVEKKQEVKKEEIVIPRIGSMSFKIWDMKEVTTGLREIAKRVCPQLNMEFSSEGETLAASMKLGGACLEVEIGKPYLLQEYLTLLQFYGEVGPVHFAKDNLKIEREMRRRLFPLWTEEKMRSTEALFLTSLEEDDMTRADKLAYWIYSHLLGAIFNAFVIKAPREVEGVIKREDTLFDDLYQIPCQLQKYEKNLLEMSCCLAATGVPVDIDLTLSPMLKQSLIYDSNPQYENVNVEKDGMHLLFSSMMKEVWVSDPVYFSSDKVQVEVVQMDYEMKSERGYDFEDFKPIYFSLPKEEWKVTISTKLPAKAQPVSCVCSGWVVEKIVRYGATLRDPCGVPKSWDIEQRSCFSVYLPGSAAELFWVTFWEGEKWITFPMSTSPLPLVEPLGHYETDLARQVFREVEFFQDGVSSSWSMLEKRIDEKESGKIARVQPSAQYLVAMKRYGDDLVQSSRYYPEVNTKESLYTMNFQNMRLHFTTNRNSELEDLEDEEEQEWQSEEE